MWLERIVAQRASGQSICGWCKANGCAEHAFYYWRRRLGKQPPGVPSAGSRDRRALPEVASRAAGKPMGFAEVLATLPVAQSMNSSVILLRLGGQRELVLPAAMDVEQIAKLVRAIERQP
jgi:transposase-like protein